MSSEFRLPDLGEGVTEGQIVRVLVAEGDHVIEDQPLMEVETDKAAVEIPSPYTGVVAQVHVTEQQVVNVGDVMVTFAADEAEAQAVEVKPVTAAAVASTHADPSAPPAATLPKTAGGGITPASPAVRKLARKLGVDLDSIAGSGPAGRVTRADLEQAAAAPPLPPAAPVSTPGTAGTDTWGPIRREKVSRARRTIAEAMARSKAAIPHVTDTDDADVTDLDRLREGYESPEKPDRKLTVLPFVIRAVALALSRHPIFNASYDADAGEIIHHDYIGVAVGVHTERGLVAPVLRNPDRMTIPGIADELTRLATKARAGSFEVNDTRGGTFTISNAGAMGGSRYSTPIINHPQAAVLALGRSRHQPWVVDGAVVPRLILPLSVSFDHRIIDGAHAIAFMREIVKLLQNPASLMLQ
ncbi:MAG: dihydrolipoamide acetyltransferase family protein [Planctomycetota bacterium]|jgi:pyruvate/2-oxoglutarate dehydrogenase complex dihydrolipoamide acyltransferase (E2) component